MIYNYKDLIINPVFICSSIALGLSGLPCVAWIALAPVILVTVGKVSLIAYGLWQLPVFASTILGNMFLHRLTRWLSLRQLLALGTVIITAGLLLTFVLPACYGESFIYLLPGLIVYFFGLGIIGSPLSRFVLFSTTVAKGTASALMSMILMCVQALGIQIANGFYATHSNCSLGLYCLVVGLLFCSVVFVTTYCLQPRHDSRG
jgi:DHA1 family multidrug/chloramphenicol efflux transport protein-like MFS transporter